MCEKHKNSTIFSSKIKSRPCRGPQKKIEIGFWKSTDDGVDPAIFHQKKQHDFFFQNNTLEPILAPWLEVGGRFFTKRPKSHILDLFCCFLTNWTDREPRFARENHKNSTIFFSKIKSRPCRGPQKKIEIGFWKNTDDGVDSAIFQKKISPHKIFRPDWEVHPLVYST